MTTVTDAPVARNTDPITSVIAGENQAAREASELEVIAGLEWHANQGKTATDEDIHWWHWMFGLSSKNYTPQRIRTARAQLVKKGLVVEAGRRENASPTGRSAMTWKLAQR